MYGRAKDDNVGRRDDFSRLSGHPLNMPFNFSPIGIRDRDACPPALWISGENNSQQGLSITEYSGRYVSAVATPAQRNRVSIVDGHPPIQNLND